MTMQTLSIDEWLNYIENKIEKNNFSEVYKIKKNITNLAKEKHGQALCNSLYAHGWKAFNNERINIAKELFYWLEELDTKNWYAQLAGAMLRQKTVSKSEASKQFKRFVMANPIFSYQTSNNNNAINIGVLLSLGNEDIDFTGGGFSLPNGLTETQHLTKSSEYSVSALFVEGISAKDIEPFDCIINAVSDSDVFFEQLVKLQDILQDCDKPIINHPKYSILTTRDYIYQHSEAIEGLIIPKLVKVTLKAEEKNCLAISIALHQLRYPVLIRPAGKQNGHDFIFLEHDNDVNNYSVKTGDYYLSEYHEFKSKDGFYRKYRCWCIGDKITFNHLIMSDKWNVHSAARFETMTNNQWMGEEEEAFSIKGINRHSEHILNTMFTLKNIINLDYFGIDFSLTEKGEIILFEANATMRSTFYKKTMLDFPYTKEVTNKHINNFHELIVKKYQ